MKVLFASLLLAASGQLLAQSSGQVGGLYPWWQEIYSKVDFSSIADNKKIPTGMLLPVGICFYINSCLIRHKPYTTTVPCSRTMPSTRSTSKKMCSDSAW